VRNRGWLTVLALAAALPARAEDGERLRGASSVVPASGGGLLSTGGPTLRYLPPGAQRWETLHRQGGDNLSRVGAGDGQVLAAWEKDPFVHYFVLASKQHVRLPKPKPPSANYASFQVHSLLFSTTGKDALVFMNGVNKRGARGPSAAFRVALDGQSAPELLFQEETAALIRTWPHGAIYALPQTQTQRCDEAGCTPVSALVNYEVNGDGVRRETLMEIAGGGKALALGAKAVHGSNPERTMLLLELDRGNRSVLSWRHGGKPTYWTLPPSDSSSQPTGMMVAARDADELIELRKRGIDLEVKRYRPVGEDRVTVLPASQTRGAGFHGFGFRINGEVWLHWGNRLALLDPGESARSFSLEAFAPRAKWAGADLYRDSPEGLWIGIEAGGGRDFAYLSFADAEKRAKPWSSGPTRCGHLPPVETLMKWERYEVSECGDGRPTGPRAPPLPPLPEVVLELPDGTSIVYGKEQGCFRARVVRCNFNSEW